MLFDAERKSYYEPVMPIPEETFSLLSKYLTVVMKCYGYSLVCENEAKRLHLIAPVIMCVVSLLPDVVVKVQEDLNGGMLMDILNSFSSEAPNEFTSFKPKKKNSEKEWPKI
jgi:hypothetical protein